MTIQVMDRRRVLVVDDYLDSAESTALLLRYLGCDTAVAFDGAQALRVAEAFRPQLCFMDIAMPIMDGRTTARAIKKTPWGKDISIIALTATPTSSLALDSDFISAIAKPASLEMLSALVNAVQPNQATAHH